MTVTKEGLDLRRALLDSLRAEKSNLERELKLQQQQLEAITTRSEQQQSSFPRSAIDAVARYARKKGVLAARAIRDGQGDPGHIRDLADAAVFGSSLAATTLAEITLATKTINTSKQQIEAHAWLRLAALLEPADKTLVRRARELGKQMDRPALAASRQLLGAMEERRAALLTNPYDQP
jgi:hypothetical protein